MVLSTWWFSLHGGSKKPTSGAETDFSETDFLVPKNNKNENKKYTKTKKALLQRGLI